MSQNNHEVHIQRDGIGDQRVPAPRPGGRDAGALALTGLDVVIGIVELGRRLFVAFQDRARWDRERPVSQWQLSYREVVDFFVTNRDEARDAHAGSIIRESSGDRVMVRLVFLDRSGRPLADAPAMAYRVSRLDDELAAAFGPHDVIVMS